MEPEQQSSDPVEASTLVPVVELLLSRGANKEHRNVSDYTPLSLAASGGYVNIIKILLNAGAEINSRTGSKLGISPLMLAAMNGHVPAVKLLLDMGSDINAQIETNRNTALTLACFQGRAEVVSLLLDRKANVEHRAKTGLTPLMEAASGGYAEVGRVLLDKGADVNSPPVPSSRDTALTIAADKGHYKFCELLINRGAHIDVRNKKGNTPMWLAANGGHFDIVQLLDHAGADVDAADNRKITPLMSAFRKGHLKVVQFLVKEVNQFPSDIECMRYIATITDKDLLKKCHQCMETIVKAKDQQAAEANKNASILLKELDLEKSREESRKQALAAKREKRKEKRKKKKEEQKKKLEDDDCKLCGTCDLDPEDVHSGDEEDDVPLEPPSATTMTTIGISATSTTFTNVFGKRSSLIITPNTNLKMKKNKPKDLNLQLIVPDQHIVQQTSDQDKTNDEPREVSASVLSEFVMLGHSDCSNDVHVNKSQEFNNCEDNLSGGKKCPLLLNNWEEKSKMGISKSFSRVENDASHRLPPSSYKATALTLPNLKLSTYSPKRSQKREEGWKEVVRRSKKLSVPASVVSRIMGRGGCNITAIQDVTGAHIDVDKQKDKNGERMITIRGGTESTRYVVQLINALIQDPAKELEDLIPKGHIRSPKTLINSSSGAGIASTNRSTSFVTGPTVPSMARVLTAFQSSKQTKNIQEIVHPHLHGVHPMSTSQPQFALLAQPMQPVRHTALPLTQLGGTFRPPPCTWGPFPVRSSGKTMSPKHTLQEADNTAQTDASLFGSSLSTSKLTEFSQHSNITNSPSSIRKQLFPSNLKSSGGVSVSSDATSKCTTVSSMPISTMNNVLASAISSEGQAEHYASTKSFSAIQRTIRPLDQSIEMRPPGINWPDNSSFTSDQIFCPSSSPSANKSVKEEAFSGSTSERSEPKVAIHMTEAPSEPDNKCGVAHMAHANQYALHRMQYRSPLNAMVATKQMQQDEHTLFVTDSQSSNMQGPLQQAAIPPTLPPPPINSQVHLNLASKQLQQTLGPTILNHFSGHLNQVPCNQGWAGCHSSVETSNQFLTDQATGPDNAMLGHIENFHSLIVSNPPGFRSSSLGRSSGSAASFDGLDNCPLSMSAPAMTSFETNLYPSQMFLQGPNVCSPGFSRQHFSPHPWTNSSNACATLCPSALSGSTSPLPSATDPQLSVPMQPINFTNDRKIPPPIGTERLARIRQSGSCAFGNTYSPPVGQNGIWSFGVNSAPDGFPEWSQPVMNSHVFHQPQPENAMFSQHQYMERDEYGVLHPSNGFHRPTSSTVIDFSKALPGTWTSPFGTAHLKYVN